GVDEFGPYFTMELVAGRELSELAPFEWRVACRLAIDIASALSLLHSRRLVYRDLNPRNVYCIPNGSAKLLDFGATVSMGVSKQVVGTPAYCPPEVLDLQPLDGRTDLYALGATLYFMLTGRHAYVVNVFQQLRAAWPSRPARPSELVSDIPEALDALVMELLQLNPAARPLNATEVIEQLAVIAGHSVDEQLQVKQAYLSTPSLVGREPLLTRMRVKVERALLGRGNALLLNGSSGVGRTRLLGAAAIDAQLLGALVLRADRADATSGDYGVLRALAIQLLDKAPELAMDAASRNLILLGHVLPELLRDRDDITLERLDDVQRERGPVIAALRNWFYAVSDKRPLVVAVDDMHAIDEPSAAVLALCARDIDAHAMLILATADVDATAGPSSSALKLFASAASQVRVANLTALDTEQLLRSVFGDTPQLSAIAQKLYAIGDGNPRDTMRIAQYLVDRDLAQYRAGAWSMSANFDDADLPASMSQALRSQVDALSPRALELARAMSLSPDRGISFEECLGLCPAIDAKRVIDSLDELVASEIVDGSNDTYVVSHRGLRAAIEQGIDPDDRRRLHAALATLFERRGNEDFRCAIHRV
ncbi:MAG TPA: AAA family ATPase, partial [Polyangiales bacterium]|nr:AAA family ATPase [Polyangiales bacterium]